MRKFILAASVFALSQASRAIPEADAAARSVTFNRDLAPLIFHHCAACHHPGGTGPFSLLQYPEARKHFKEIAAVTAKRIMPPWLPAPQRDDFTGARRLSDAEINLFQRWALDGALEGRANDLRPAPVFSNVWQLGPPDLVLTLPMPYHLAPEGPDVYRNFVVPLQLASSQFVQAFEFHPGNPSIHHVRILLDATGQCRHLEGQPPEPGFGGMNVPAKFPPGHLLTWAPGRSAHPNPPGLTWRLDPGTDIVLQIHMQRTGRAESVQPQIGFYFTNTAPSHTPFVMGMLAQTIDIPPGAANYTITRGFEMPADADLLAVMPHAHYLARDLQLTATLPNRERRGLLSIPRWDFNWQEEYRYQNPVRLPRGAKIQFTIRYDNSENNARNPNTPPKRVLFGPQSTDEMGEIWLQLLPVHPADIARFQQEKKRLDARETAEFYEKSLRANPADALAHVGLGKVLGPLGQPAAAASHFRAALALHPNQPEAHYYLGLMRMNSGDLADAQAEFRAELRVNPSFYKAHVALAMISIEQQDLAQAELHVRSGLKINPEEPSLKEMLARILRAKAGTAP